MSGALILLLPMLVLSVVLLFAFAGCGLDVVGKAPITPPGTTPPPETPPTYKDAIMKTPGLIAYWRLGETKLPADPYPPAKDETGKLPGTYHGPVALGSATGALATKEPADKGAGFNGDGYVEVPFGPALDIPQSF